MKKPTLFVSNKVNSYQCEHVHNPDLEGKEVIPLHNPFLDKKGILNPSCGLGP